MSVCVYCFLGDVCEGVGKYVWVTGHVLNMYAVIKRVSTLTHEAHAALFGAWTGGEDDPWAKVYEHTAS